MTTYDRAIVKYKNNQRSRDLVFLKTGGLTDYRKNDEGTKKYIEETGMRKLMQMIFFQSH